MRARMHGSFVVFVQSDKGITQLTPDAWIERLSASKAKETGTGKARPEMKADITVLDRSGKGAVAKVASYRDGKQIFIDYISLYRFEDGSKLVAKTSHRHSLAAMCLNGERIVCGSPARARYATLRCLRRLSSRIHRQTPR